MVRWSEVRGGCFSVGGGQRIGEQWYENGAGGSSGGKQVKPTLVSFCNQTRIWESLPESESIWFGLRLTALDWG